MNTLKIMENKYDIVRDNIHECLKDVFNQHDYNSKMSDINILKDFCEKEGTRVLFVNVTEGNNFKVKFIDCTKARASHAVYKITKFNNKYYLDWRFYSGKGSGTVKIPVFMEHDGTVTDVAIIQNNKMKIKTHDEESFSTNKIEQLEECLTRVDHVLRFLDKNDCLPEDVNCSENIYIKTFRNMSTNYARKMGVIGLPYMRMKWNHIRIKYVGYINLKKNKKTTRDEYIDQIKLFINKHDKFPSPFSKTNYESILGYRLHKYMDGCKYLRSKMFEIFGVEKNDIKKELFYTNSDHIQNNIKSDRFWFTKLREEIEKTLEDWIIKQQLRFVSTKMDEDEEKIWMNLYESLTEINPHLSNFFEHQTDTNNSFVSYDSNGIDLNKSSSDIEETENSNWNDNEAIIYPNPQNGFLESVVSSNNMNAEIDESKTILGKRKTPDFVVQSREEMLTYSELLISLSKNYQNTSSKKRRIIYD